MFQEFPDDNKGDDFLNEFRQKIADQSAANIEEKRNELKRSKSVFIGAVSGVALAGIVGWFVLSPQYANNSDKEIPVIRRPQTAVKVQPSEPGGMEILNQDKTVYDIIEKKDNEPAVENLLPPPEQPKLPEIVPAPEPAPLPVVETAPQPQLKVNDNAGEKVVGTVATAEVKETALVPAAPAAQVTGDAPEAKVIGLKELSQQENKAAAAQPAPAPKAEAPKAEPVKEYAPKQAVAGMWQIQLMSSPNKKAVEKAWTELTQKYKVLRGQPYEIEAADLDFDKTFYRLKAGAFETRSGADELCKDVKALGGSCIVKKK